jgi:ribosomal protein L14E/L6E/L27E
MNEISVGSVVLSKSGRDKGKFYLVVKILDKSYAQIADGDVRKIEKPKKKKSIHLRVTGTTLENLREKLLGGKTVHNKELISALKAFNNTEQGESHVKG